MPLWRFVFECLTFFQIYSNEFEVGVSDSKSSSLLAIN